MRLVGKAPQSLVVRHFEEHRLAEHGVGNGVTRDEEVFKWTRAHLQILLAGVNIDAQPCDQADSFTVRAVDFLVALQVFQLDGLI
jgi:hypothetical protein